MKLVGLQPTFESTSWLVFATGFEWWAVHYRKRAACHENWGKYRLLPTPPSCPYPSSPIQKLSRISLTNMHQPLFSMPRMLRNIFHRFIDSPPLLCYRILIILCFASTGSHTECSPITLTASTSPCWLSCFFVQQAGSFLIAFPSCFLSGLFLAAVSSLVGF